ncbi:MAG: hypothetical protein ACLQVD_18295 [Capsulimonadaceae bacterium]
MQSVNQRNRSSDNSAPPSTRAFAIFVSLCALALASWPYMAGYLAHRSGRYLWAGTSVSDFAVYLAWIREARDGFWRDQHLFAGGRPGMPINPVYWVLGVISRATEISPTAAYHVGRVLCGALLLAVLWRFVRMALLDPLERRLAFLFLCFSSGFGWLLGFLSPHQLSIDMWQPEAFTFLSLYTYPHFCLSLALQVAILALLLKSDLTGDARYAAGAGLCGALLAAEHAYDVVTVAAIWAAYAMSPLAAGWRASPQQSMRNHLIAVLLACPGVLYILVSLRLDRVFASRDVVTLSLPLHTILIGYGGLLLLAVYGACLVLASLRGAARTDASSSPFPLGGGEPERAGIGSHIPARFLLVVWSVVNVAVSYLPVDFQRKMLQGEHVALSLLAAVGAAQLLRRVFPAGSWDSLRWPEIALAAFLSIGSIVYLQRDVRDVRTGVQQGMFRPALSMDESRVMAWVERNTPARAVVQPVPSVIRDKRGRDVDDLTLSLLTPGLTGRAVYYAHWSETPDFAERRRNLDAILRADTPEIDRTNRIEQTGISYWIVTPDARTRGAAQPFDFRSPSFQAVFHCAGACVYHYVPPDYAKKVENTLDKNE